MQLFARLAPCLSALMLVLFLGVDGHAQAGTSSGLGSKSNLIVKGTKPASGLVVNVPSGGRRIGLTQPEATFLNESAQQTFNRVLFGMPTIQSTSLGNIVSNPTPAMPVSMVLSAKDKAQTVRVDIPGEYSLGVFTLVTRSNQRIPLLTSSTAFFLDVEAILAFGKLGMAKLEMRFYSPKTLKFFDLSVTVGSSGKLAFLDF